MGTQYLEQLRLLVDMAGEEDLMSLPLLLMVLLTRRFPWAIEFAPAWANAPGAGTHCTIRTGQGDYMGSGPHWGVALVRVLRAYLEAEGHGEEE